MNTTNALCKKDLIRLFGEYCIYKCKSFSQNSVIDKYKANIFLSASYDFKSFREISVFIKNARKLGILSVSMLEPCLSIFDYFLTKNSHFNPNMEEQEYLQYFFSLTKTYKPATIKRNITALSVFLRFLGNRGYVVKDLSQIRLNFLKEKTLPSYLCLRDYNMFLQEVQKMSEDSVFSLKTKLAILLVYYTGIRTREVANIMIEDISEDYHYYVIKIKGKGAKERLVSIKKSLIESVYANYMQARAKHKAQSVYLFQLRNHNTPPKININLKPLLQKINCVQNRGNKLHLLRHSFASFVYSKSRDILLTQQILGHSNIASTQIYIHLDNELHEKVANFF
ncbi:tyrosine-type recombinase/integrase [uncultured Helicobacter sp.]|uniref:tyrosine-type recombinase/integrase n=1 Tax=uncultured Helicobacter sp. TaxID=175537 RepID=UPI00374F9576